MIHDTNAELCAIYRIHSGDKHMVKQLEPGDFGDSVTREIFTATKAVIEKHGEFDPFKLDLTLEDGRRPRLWWAELVLGSTYMGSQEQIVAQIKRMRARREAQEFRAKGQDHEISAEFIRKGKEIEGLLKQKTDNWEQIVDAIENPPGVLPTGFRNFDYLSNGGVREGGMLVIAANPGTGKTTLATNIAKNLVSKGKSVHFVSLEMPDEDIVMRFMQVFWEKSAAEVRESIRDAAAKDLRADFSVNNPGHNINNVVADITNNIEKDLFIIDHFGLIEVNSKESQVQKLEQISNILQGFSLEIRKPMVVLSQLNRDIEKDRGNREPQLSDIRGTGALAQVAHTVSFLWDKAAKDRGENVLADLDGSSAERDLRWVIKKNRYGQLGQVALDFDYRFMSFRERSVADTKVTQSDLPF